MQRLSNVKCYFVPVSRCGESTCQYRAEKKQYPKIVSGECCYDGLFQYKAAVLAKLHIMGLVLDLRRGPGVVGCTTVSRV